MANPAAHRWPAFLRLWAVLEMSYVGIRLLFNLVLLGWVDLRPVFLADIAVVPLGEAIVLWLVTRRSRALEQTPSANNPGTSPNRNL